MKITINREKYINHECPRIPKKVMDVYYSKLMVHTRNVLDIYALKKINTINIRINQAFAGCHGFHFYTSINGMEEFHQRITDYDLPFWGGISKKTDKMHPRCEWLTDFERCGVDMGPNKAKEKIDMLWFIKKQKAKSKNRVKVLKRELDQLAKLQEKYDR